MTELFSAKAIYLSLNCEIVYFETQDYKVLNLIKVSQKSCNAHNAA